MNQTVLVIGSANLDFVFQCDQLPNPGETVLGRGFETFPGGKGANQAVAIGRLGGSVAFVGCVGNDNQGGILKDSLLAGQVNVDWLSISQDESTGVAGIFVDADGRNSIVVESGANRLVTEDMVRNAISQTKPQVVLAQLETPIEALPACGDVAIFVLNPAPYRELPRELLTQIDVITPNESETESLTKVSVRDLEGCAKATAILHKKGVRNVVLTLGERGCYVSDGERGQILDPPKVDVVDTTAAGDAFSGALAHFLASGHDIWESARRANVVGALATTKRGAQNSMPTYLEFNKFLERSARSV